MDRGEIGVRKGVDRRGGGVSKQGINKKGYNVNIRTRRTKYKIDKEE